MGDTKIVIPGGTGHIGRMLSRAFADRGHEVVVVTRGGKDMGHGIRVVRWDGPWRTELDGCDAVINLVGRSVSCRYTEANLREMMDSRVETTKAVGRAIERAGKPPRVWLQMSTATIYAHRYDAPNEETAGVIGGNEPDAPAYWKFSVDIARNWEKAQEEADTPTTRKVALRTAMVMGPEPGGAFNHLLRMVRLGVGGPVDGGRQYMSWIHDEDMVNAVEFLLANDISGPVNLASPDPLPHRDFMRTLRKAWGMPVGIPATKWMAELGAFVIGTDTELLLKSRRVIPGRLLKAGFEFRHPDWSGAAADLVRRTHSW